MTTVTNNKRRQVQRDTSFTSSLLSRSQAAIAASAPSSSYASPVTNTQSQKPSATASPFNSFISPIHTHHVHTAMPRRPSFTAAESPNINTNTNDDTAAAVAAMSASASSSSSSTGVDWIDSMARVLRRQTAGMKRASDGGDLLTVGHHHAQTAVDAADLSVDISADSADAENDEPDESFTANENTDTSNNIFSPTTRRLRPGNKPTARVEAADLSIAKAEIKRFNARYTAVATKNDALTAQTMSLQDAVSKRDAFIKKLIEAFVTLKNTHDNDTVTAQHDRDELSRQLTAAQADISKLNGELAIERKRFAEAQSSNEAVLNAHNADEQRTADQTADMNDRLKSAQSEMQRLMSAVSVQHQQIDHLTSENRALSERAVHLTSENDHLRESRQDEVSQLRAELSLLRAHNETSRAENDRINLEMKRRNDQLTTAQTECQSKDKQIALLNERIHRSATAAVDAVDNHQADEVNASGALTPLKTRTSVVTALALSAPAKSRPSRQETAVLTETAVPSGDSHSADMSIPEFNSERLISALQDDRQRLTSTIDILTLEMAQLRADHSHSLSERESEFALHSQVVATKDAELKVMNEKCAEFALECHLFNEKLSDLTSRLDDVTKQRDSAVIEVERLDSQSQQLRAEMSRLHAKTESRVSELEDEMDRQKSSIQELTGQLDTVYAAKQRVTTQAESDRAAFEESLSELKRAHSQEIVSLKSELTGHYDDEIRRRQQMIDGRTIELDELINQLASAHETIRDLQDALSRTRTNVDQAQADLIAAREQADVSHAEEIAHFTASVSELMTQVRVDQSQQSDLQSAIQRMTNEISELQSANDAQQRQFAETSAECEALHRRIFDLEQQNAELQSTVDRLTSTVIVSLTDELTLTKAKLNKANIKLNEVSESHINQLAEKVERSDYDILVQQLRGKEIELKSAHRELNKFNDEIDYLKKEVTEECERRSASEQSYRELCRQFEQSKRDATAREHTLIESSHEALSALKEEHRTQVIKKDNEYRVSQSTLSDRLHDVESRLESSTRDYLDLKRTTDNAELLRTRKLSELEEKRAAAEAEWETERRSSHLAVQTATAQYNRVLTSPTKGGRNIAAEEAAAVAAAELVREHQNRIDTLTAENRELIRARRTLTEEMRGLVDPSTYQCVVTDLEGVKTELAVSVANGSKISGELNSLSQALSDESNKRRQCEMALRELQERFDNAKSHFASRLKEMTEEYSTQIHSLQSEEENIHSRHVDEITHVKAENDSVKRDLAAVKPRLNAAIAEATRLTETVNQQSAERSSLIEQINQLQSAVDLHNRAAMSNESAADKDNAISDLTADKQSLHAELKQMQSELTALTASLPSLSSLHIDVSERDQYRLDLAEERSRLTQSEAIRSRLLVELSECQSELRAYRAQSATLQQQVNQQMQNMTDSLLKWDNERVRFMQTITQLKAATSPVTSQSGRTTRQQLPSTRSSHRDAHPPTFDDINNDDTINELYAAEATLRHERTMWSKQRNHLEAQIHRAMTHIDTLKAEKSRQIEESKAADDAAADEDSVTQSKYIALELKCARYKERCQQFKRHATSLHQQLKEERQRQGQGQRTQTVDVGPAQSFHRQIADVTSSMTQWKERALAAEHALNEQSTSLTTFHTQFMCLKQEQLHLKHVIPNIVRATHQAVVKQVSAHINTFMTANQELSNKNALLIKNFHKIKSKMNERYDKLLSQHHDFMQTYQTLIQSQRDDLLNDSVSQTHRSPLSHPQYRNTHIRNNANANIS